MSAARKMTQLRQGIRRQRRAMIASVGGAIVAIIMVLALAQNGLALSGGSATQHRHLTGFNLNIFEGGTYSPTHGYLQGITITGQGVFSPPSGGNDGGYVNGSGIWAVDNGTTGHNIASGYWTAVKFVHWTSYGAIDPREEGGNLSMIVALHFDRPHNVVYATLYVSCIDNLPVNPVTGYYTYHGKPVLEGGSLAGLVFDFTILFVLNSGDPSFGIGISDFYPNVQGGGLADSEVELAAISRSSIGACHLGCC